MPKKPPKTPIIPVGASINDTCQRHSVSRSSLYNDIRDKKVIARKKGARTIVDVASADKYYGSLPRMQSSSANPASKALAARLAKRAAKQAPKDGTSPPPAK